MRKLTEAHRMIGSAERLLWPGKRPTSRVAVSMPRSAEVWDERGEPHEHGISDATNTNLNGSTVDHMTEVADLYLVLQRANWTGERISQLWVSLAQLSRVPRRITSMKRRALTWSHSKGGVTVQLPLDSSDILMVDW